MLLSSSIIAKNMPDTKPCPKLMCDESICYTGYLWAGGDLNNLCCPQEGWCSSWSQSKIFHYLPFPRY